MKRQGKFEFSQFTLDPRTRTLKRLGEAVTLNRRAFDVLEYLLQNSGRIVSRDELVRHVWPDTFVDENSLARSISALRQALEEKPGDNNYIVTVPGRGYQFVSEVQSTELEVAGMVPEGVASGGAGGVILERETIRASITRQDNELRSLPAPRLSRIKVVTAILLLAVVGGGGYLLRLRFTHRLSAKDTVVLADFANTTGDSVFDDTLRQGLSSQLEQSPFLSLLTDRRATQALNLMSKPPETRLTPEVARDVCLRSHSTAVLNGSIAQVGTRYLLTLKAVSCSNGDTLASASAQANDKNHVLDALGKLAAEIRPKLGESLASVEKYDVPLQDVTTSSLEALQAYSLGLRSFYRFHDGFKAQSFYKRAVALDPNFASAYARIGLNDYNANELTSACENLEKAYQLRDRVSEPERLFIEAHHWDIVIGDLEAARKTYEMWAEIYPRDMHPWNGLTVISEMLGDYDEDFKANQASLKLDPDEKTNNNNRVLILTYLGRTAEARTAATDWLRRFPDDPVTHDLLYDVYFLEKDGAGMQREAAWLMGKPDWEDDILWHEAKTEAYGGHFAQARQLTRRAADSAVRADTKEAAAGFYADSAEREALVGNVAVAKQFATDALALGRDVNIDASVALSLALIGDRAKSMELVDGVRKEEPKFAPMQSGLLPAVRAAAILSSDPRKAIDILAVATPYEYAHLVKLYTAYFRGYAYIATRQGSAAVGEFQKITGHSGIVGYDIIGSLAHLGLARAYMVAGDSKKAKAEYDNFLTLWKDADPDIPILKQAKAEYAKLQS
jgi:eukaryotic-like serine/threonine-protein kinase